jgi:hypothetical protein
MIVAPVSRSQRIPDPERRNNRPPRARRRACSAVGGWNRLEESSVLYHGGTPAGDPSMARFLPRFLLAAVTVVVTAELALGQPGGGPGRRQLEPTEPLRLPGEPDVEDFRPYLEGKAPKTKAKDLDPQKLKELMEKLNKMPKDQQPDKAQIEQMLKNNPAFKDPEFLKQLEKMFQDPDFPKNLEGKLPKDVPVPNPEQGPDLKNKLQELVEQGKQQGPPKIVGEAGAVGGKDGPKLPDPAKLPNGSQPATNVDNEWVKWMEKNFGDSPAAQQAVKDLVDGLSKTDMKGMFDDVPELKNGAWKDIGDWGKSNGLDLGKIKPPDVSTGGGGSSSGGGGGSGPIWGGGGGGSSSGGGGSVGGVGLGGGGTALAIIAGIAAAAFLALLLFRRWKLEQARQAAHGATGGLGIDFDAIRTREELVQAFDHVSLDQMGEDARPWNHRVIADQLAEARPAQAAPANELAGLYERARYAPADEDLSAGEFADARRDLRVISGVPA